MAAVGLVLVGFAVIISALALHGLHNTSTVWLRSTLNGLAHPHGGFLRRAAFAPLTLLGRGVLWVEHYARAGISHWASASSNVLANWLTGLHIVWHGMVNELGAITYDTADALGYLRHRTVPHLINISLWPVKQAVREAHRLAHSASAYAHAEAHRIWRGIDHLEHRLTARFTKLYHGIDQFVHHTVWPRVRTAERAIAGVVSRDLPRIRREEQALSRRLTKLEKLLGVGALTALIVRVLAKRFPWLFCRNVRNVGRQVCGLDPTIIADAFGLLVTAEMLTNFPELVRILQAVTRETTEAIKELSEV